jgi:hypothetical protein
MNILLDKSFHVTWNRMLARQRGHILIHSPEQQAKRYPYWAWLSGMNNIMRGIQDSSPIASSQIEVVAKPVRQSGNTIAEQVRSSDLPMPHAQNLSLSSRRTKVRGVVGE